jgi:hypothetical protein
MHLCFGIISSHPSSKGPSRRRFPQRIMTSYDNIFTGIITFRILISFWLCENKLLRQQDTSIYQNTM